jgi:hypothetical protein
MHACVHLATADGRVHILGHGDVIGRLWSAALPLSDPRVSEAHALVSLRAGQLRLLALRRLFALDGKPSKELVLEAGQRIAFARDLEVEVRAVALPDHVLGLEGDGLPRQPLPGACCLMLQPQPALVPGLRPGHAAAFWSDGAAWRVRRPGGAEAPLEPGWSLVVEGQRFAVVPIALQRAGEDRTRQAGAVQAPLRLELHWDSAHIHRSGQPTTTLNGHAARLLTELAQARTGLPWADLAAGLWPDGGDRHQLRRRFDVLLSRLRGRLRDAGVRTDLVRSDGGGNFSLVLRPEDTVDDRS